MLRQETKERLEELIREAEGHLDGLKEHSRDPKNQVTEIIRILEQVKTWTLQTREVKQRRLYLDKAMGILNSASSNLCARYMERRLSEKEALHTQSAHDSLTEYSLCLQRYIAYEEKLQTP